MNKVIYYLSHPERLILEIGRRKFFCWMPDEMYLKMIYRMKFGKPLNLDDPQTFNEKLQWLKLYDRKPIYTTMVDKYAAKKYVADIIGEEFIIPTLGAWDRAEDIDFDVLPEQFVLKCNHDSGGLIIVKDKTQLNKEKAILFFQKKLKQNGFWYGREWPYKNVPPKIIAEKYMEDDKTAGLSDYKVHCFNGEPKVILVCKNRYSRTGITEDFYSPSWEHLNISRPKASFSKEIIEKPEQLEEMLNIAHKLSESIPFLRVDYYIINSNLYIGELTFYPASGFKTFIPNEWDTELGSWLKLPTQ